MQTSCAEFTLDDVGRQFLAAGQDCAGQLQNLQCAGPVGQTPYEAAFLQGRNQAVDAGFAPSAWTPSGSFIIDTVPPEVTDFTFNRTQAGIGQTVTLALSLVDVHAGIDADLEPTVVAVINGQEFAFTALQFTSSTWNGQLIIRADMPTGAATVGVRPEIPARISHSLLKEILQTMAIS